MCSDVALLAVVLDRAVFRNVAFEIGKPLLSLTDGEGIVERRR